MFEKLRNLFSEEKEEKEKVKVKLRDVESWLQSENKEFYKNLESEIQKNYNSFDQDLKNLEEKFSKFKEAEIDPEVIKMIKKAANTNKKNIEKNLQFFIKSISIPSSTDHENAYSFCKEVSSRLKEFARKSEKGLGILSRVLKDETKDLRAGLTGLEGTLNNFMVYLNKKKKTIKKIKESKDLTKEIKTWINEKQDSKQRLKKLKKKLKNKKQKTSNIKKEIEKINQSKELSKFKNLLNQKNKAKEKLNKLKERELQEISYLEKAFKKLSHRETGERSEQIKKYLDSSRTLTKKDSKELKELMDFLEENLEKLDLSTKRKNKALKGIKRIRSGTLDDLIEEYEKTKEKISDLKSKINSSTVLEKKNKKQQQYKEQKRETDELEQKIKDLKTKIQQTNLEEKIQTLEDKLEDLTKKEVKIVVS